MNTLRVHFGDCSSDTYAQDSIDMLSNSAGIDFSRSLDNGIDQNEFGELLISSGLVLLEDVTWITFTGYAPSLLALIAVGMISDTF